MNPDDLVAHFPYLYHMAHGGSWPSIKAHGLLSTSALLDRFGIAGPERTKLESQQRTDSVTLHHPDYGSIVIRDQKPLSEKNLLKCLSAEMIPRQWYEMLNARVFFWLTPERLTRLLTARAYRSSPQTILTMDTKALLDRHAAHISLSAINSGSAIYAPQPRGPNTFQTIQNYPFETWKAKRGVRQAVTELAVSGGIPRIEEVLVRVEEWRNGGPMSILWSR